MVYTRAAGRYAKAMLSIANDTDSLDAIVEDFATIGRALESSRELRLMTQSPVIDDEKKWSVLREIFSDKISDASMRMLQVLAEKGRLQILEETVREFKRLVDIQLGVVVAKITAASELSEENRQRVLKRLESLTGREIRPEYGVDPELIGGFTAVIGDRLIDASVSHQLHKLHDQLTAGAASWTPEL